MVTYHTYTPPAPLSAYVERIWLHEESAQPHPQERALPTGRPALWIDLGGDGLRATAQVDPCHMWAFPTSVLLGAHSRWFLVEAGRHISRMGVIFKPGGAAPFFAPPASELHGTHVPLEALWGRCDAEEVRERLSAETTPEARFHTLERFLLTRLARETSRGATHNDTPHPAVARALRALLRAPKPRTIAQVVDESGLSHRQFIAVFRREVGMSPKVFYRLRRFLDVVYRARETDRVAWAEMALACGFYDQSHLAHDFSEFAGVSPTTYLRLRDPSSPTYLPFAPGAAHELQELQAHHLPASA
jgi:AraC-like DNA-binding protein